MHNKPLVNWPVRQMQYPSVLPVITMALHNPAVDHASARMPRAQRAIVADLKVHDGFSGSTHQSGRARKLTGVGGVDSLRERVYPRAASGCTMHNLSAADRRLASGWTDSGRPGIADS